MRPAGWRGNPEPRIRSTGRPSPTVSVRNSGAGVVSWKPGAAVTMTWPASIPGRLAALTGFFVGQSRQPPPPGLPTLREFQAAQGRTALAWLKIRTTWR